MYVVTVIFEVADDKAEVFREAMLSNAKSSLENEPGCHFFDVCFDANNASRCFLYEKYDDLAAFQAHCASDHFKEFDATVSPWVTAKHVETWDLAHE